MSYEVEMTSWLRKALAVEGERTTERIEVLTRSGPKSWPQHASVPCDGRTPDAIVTEVLEHVSDIIDSAKEEGRGTWAVRLRRYVGGAPAGSRTFGSQAGAPGGSDPEPDGDAKSETVAVIRELRMVSVEFASRLASSADSGWKMSIALAKEVGELRKENAELSVALGLADQKDNGAMKQLTEAAVPMLPQLLQALAVKLSTPST